MVTDGDGGDHDDTLDGEVESAAPRVDMSHQFNTLSGREAADYRNSWEMFERLLTQENSYRSAAEYDTWNYSESNDFVNLLVSVEDTGVGIPLSVQDRVFTPFMQVRQRNLEIHFIVEIVIRSASCISRASTCLANFIFIHLFASREIEAMVEARCARDKLLTYKANFDLSYFLGCCERLSSIFEKSYH